MDIKHALKQFGLSEKEAKLFLVALEIGTAPVNLIAKKSGVARSTCYEVLESLRTQGIVSSFVKKKVRYYSAEDPKTLIHRAEIRADTLKQALPQLAALYHTAGVRPQVRFFEGKEGMKQIFEEMLGDKHECLSFSSSDDLFRAFEDYHYQFVRRRVKEKILARVILRDSPLARERQRIGPQELRIVKFIPSEFEHHGMQAIFGNKIAFFSFVKDYIVVVIESKELAAVQRAMFEWMWQHIP